MENAICFRRDLTRLAQQETGKAAGLEELLSQGHLVFTKSLVVLRSEELFPLFLTSFVSLLFSEVSVYGHKQT